MHFKDEDMEQLFFYILKITQFPQLGFWSSSKYIYGVYLEEFVKNDKLYFNLNEYGN